ncbi:MAG TPA: SseB family protein [Gammaproteobacteria bacterium]|nr:SseB family protein [Gammaproteobacteria bacterium]
MSEDEQVINKPPPMFDPNAELEYLLAGAKTGKVSIVTVYQALLRAPVYALFDREMTPENLDPAGKALIFETSDMGNLMVLFTAPELSEKLGSDAGEFTHPAQLSGEYLVNVLSENTGVILNPGHDYGMKLAAKGLQQLKRDFGSHGGPQQTGAGGGAQGIPGPSGGAFPTLN